MAGEGFWGGIARQRPNAEKPPKRWVWLPYDQQQPSHPLLDPAVHGPREDTAVVFIETAAKPARRPYHAHKLVLLMASQRHRALALAEAGHPVVVHFSEGWYDRALAEVRERWRFDRLEACSPAEAEVRLPVAALPWVHLQPNPFFITDRNFWRRVFPKPGRRLMETFYRAARRETGLLMQGAKPVGGVWNLDHENRKPWRGEPPVPPRPVFAPDAVTREVMDLVRTRYPGSFGRVDGFDWPVTPADAERAADHFFDHLLPHFGPYEDALHAHEPALFHSLLSASIHLGHLDPRTLCQRAEAAYHEGRAPLASVEGFVRQLLGWREFMRQVYEEHRDLYADTNALQATLPLPDWYWGRPSGLNCLDTTVRQVIERGHSHHITRLMVLSNVANLLGVDPHALNEWFWFAYVDAYDWVVTPNVVGMATFADGGLFITKPYVSSGKYIQRMGPSLCAGCRFDPKQATGDDACPLNPLYWDFIGRNADRLAKVPRMLLPLKAHAQLAPAQRDAYAEAARVWRERARRDAYRGG
jgi:deoxyribodipyrimidine photolyase-related protein